MALVLMPYEQVINSFNEIQADADLLPDHPMEELLLYFEKNWLNIIDLWNVSACDSRTNNVCEVKTYIDFEYYIENNHDINNHFIGTNCLLKILHLSLNFSYHQFCQSQNTIDIALKQFLVLEAHKKTPSILKINITKNFISFYSC
ncbi:unnamed protein product [Rotaria magnacalcarata]